MATQAPSVDAGRPVAGLQELRRLTQSADGAQRVACHAGEQCRWFGGMVGNHVADLVERYGSDGEIPVALTDYISARKGYDYARHGRAGNPDTEFVPDEIVDRFCVLGTVDDHVAKLRELEALGVDQFNVYLMHDAQEETLTGYGERVIPALASPAAA